MNDTPRALESFQNSLGICKQGEDFDSLLLRNTFSNLYWQYYNVQDYHNALKMAKEEYNLAKKMGILDAATVLHLGTTYIRLGHIYEAKKYFLQAYGLLYKTTDSESRNEAYFSLLYHFSTLKLKVKAQECYELIKKQKLNKLHSSDENLALGQYYLLKNHTDSAVSCYLDILKKSNDFQGKYDASKSLFQIYNHLGNKDKADMYANDFIKISDTLNLGERQLLAATVNNKYQYHIDKNKEEKARASAAFYRQLAFAVSTIACIIILILFLFLLYRRNQRLQGIITNANALILATNEVDKLKGDINIREQELEALKNSLKVIKAKLTGATAQIKQYEEELHEKERLLGEKINQNKSIIKLIHQSEFERKAEDVISDIRQFSEGIRSMSAADWTTFYNAVNKLYPYFSEMLTRKLGRIDEQELQVCYLLRIGLTNAQIQNLTGLSRTTVWRWTKKLDWILTGEI